ncbi:hypothetical protein QUF54_01535 [Candidatus Marithioploca araucensis]|uniref:Uncharacterized protein n=1 Tax=Candidatus Marithioploca araucensis TaxID=70273 RepID=A0ABT7VQT9_9GAMM|nr:hypothetical protein [Candidatus Marithioploca araucensis]
MHRTILVFGLIGITPLATAGEDVSDTLEGAKKMSSRGVKETLLSAIDVDFYKFTISTDRKNPDHDTSGNITVTLSQKAPPSLNPNSGWQVELYSETNLAKALYTAALPETSLKVKFEQGLSPGNYYFRMSSLDSVVFPAAEYTLASQWEENAYYERQPNDEPDDATAITVNETYYGNISSESDIDVYRFGLQAPDLVTISLSQKTPGIDSTLGWQVGLFSQPQTVDVLSTALSGTLEVNLDIGMHYLFVKSLPQPEEVSQDDEEAEDETAQKKEKTAPVGRPYQLVVNASSAPQAQEDCPFTFIYAQNPLTNRWASFPTPCDVPVGWFSQETAPETYEVCPSPHATYTLPKMDELGTITQQGKVKIPLLDFKDELGNVMVLRVELQQMPNTDPIQFTPDMLKLIRTIEAE